jgi:uncharacterized membrane protein
MPVISRRVHSLIALVLIACSETTVTPDSGVTEAGPVSLSISLPDGRSAKLMETDTVTVTARVFDRNGVELSTGVVVWSGNLVKTTGSRTARVELQEGENVLGASIALGADRIGSTLTITAAPYPGAVFLWNPGGELTRISLPESISRIHPSALNDRGQIAGTATLSENGVRVQRAFFWAAETGFRLVEMPAHYVSSGAVDINESGVVAGTMSRDDSTSTPFAWWASTKSLRFPDPLIDGASVAGINSAGVIGGVLMRNGNPFLWASTDGAVTSVHGGDASVDNYDALSPNAVAITDDNSILASLNGRYQEGIDYGWIPQDYATIWSAGKRFDFECVDCVLAGMNNREEVAGVAWRDPLRAFRWTRTSGFQILQAEAGESSVPLAINNAGDVAGWVTSWLNGIFVVRAAVWTRDGIKRLDPLPGFRSTIARDINSLGQALVYAR